MIFPSEEQEQEEEFVPEEIAPNAEGLDAPTEKISSETLKSGDLLVEAIDVVIQYR
jgi:hypothetical protein